MRSILKALDERFPNLFRTHPTYPCIQPTEIDANEKLTNYRFFIFYYLDQQPGFTLEEEMHLAMSIDNLQRLGLIKLNSRIIQLNYDYTKLSTHPIVLNIAQHLDQGSHLSIRNFKVELTNYGQALAKCCFAS